MISSFDVNSLKGLLKDFYNAVGIRIAIFDDDFKLVAEYPETPPLFCSLIRSKMVGIEGCKECDRNACLKAKELKRPHVYECHAGLTEAVTPISYSGSVLGYAILAHLLPKEHYDETVKNICDKTNKYGLNEAEVLNALSQLKSRSREQIDCCVHILDAIASYVYIKNIAFWKSEDIAKKIDHYIDQNIANELNSEIICQDFNISRTKLYQVSMKSYGEGINIHITNRRIEKAKELLNNNELNISEISYQSGFLNINYFCKMFKKITGFSPAKYRKIIINKE